MKIKQHAAKISAAINVALLWFGSIIAAGIAFATQVYLARTLAPEDFGLFSASLATATLISPLAGFGAAQALLKINGIEGGGGLSVTWLRTALLYTIATTIITTVALLTWAELGPHSKETREVLLVFSLFMAGQACLELTSAKLQSLGLFKHLAGWQVLPHAIRLALVITLFTFTKESPLIAAGCYAASSIAVTIITLRFLRRGTAKNATAAPRSIAKIAWPFGLATTFHIVYSQSDIVILKYLESDTVAGQYNIAFTTLLAIYLFPAAIYQKYLLPKIHNVSKDTQSLAHLHAEGAKMMLITGTAAAVILWTASDFFIQIFFGDNFSNSAAYLKILALGIPPMFVAFSAGAIISTGSLIQRKAALMFIVALTNILLNISFIPMYGAASAAWTTVACSYLLMTLYYHAAAKHLRRNL